MILEITLLQFLDAFFSIAQKQGYHLENSINGRQVDFGNKKLHEGHLAEMYPEILQPGAHIPTLIDNVAPGRPCAHKPTREIIAEMKRG